jgi:hypothetical protein
MIQELKCINIEFYKSSKTIKLSNKKILHHVSTEQNACLVC